LPCESPLNHVDEQTGTPYEGGIYDVVCGMLVTHPLAQLNTMASTGHPNTRNVSLFAHQNEVYHVSGSSRLMDGAYLDLGLALDDGDQKSLS
jgi:hypothetical protein